ncbi:protein FAM53B-like [Arapaima gigas]
MVIIHTKTLEKKKGVDDVTPRESHLELCGPPTMSQGTALFSHGGLAALTPSLPLTEAGMWPDVGRSCAIQQGPVGSSLESLWDALPETGSLTSLIRDLSLGDTTGSLQPPSKRQCRSLSCSDEPSGGGRVTWRPQGSRVWTMVEKRRCHSGGSTQHCSGGPLLGGFPAMQRSSSFSLPARSNGPPMDTEPAYFSFASLFSPCSVPPLSLYLSQEQICPPKGTQGASSASSPDSTPEMGRRVGPGGLSRSRSQPCVLNDRKIGMKRRRPEDMQEPRPSLDLAKMTQKLHSFHSLSCPGFTEVDCRLSSPTPSPSKGAKHMSSFTTASNLGTELQHSHQDDSSSDDQDSDSTGSEELRVGSGDVRVGVSPWWGPCGLVIESDANQLGGELDIEQIERN